MTCRRGNNVEGLSEDIALVATDYRHIFHKFEKNIAQPAVDIGPECHRRKMVKILACICSK